MSPVTPETLPRHELVGFRVRVSGAANPDLLDIEGDVVGETTRTLCVETGASGADAVGSATGDGRVAQIPKEGTTFEFELCSQELVTVEGRRLVGRPARRTENTGESTWR